MPRTSWVARCATRCSAVRRRTGTSPRPRLPERTVELFPGAVYENKFGTVAVRTGDPEVGDVEITTFRTRPRLRRLPPAASGRVRRVDRARTSPAATSRSTRWPGAPSPGSRRGSSTRTAARPTWRLERCGPSAIPRSGSMRMRSGWSAPSGSPPRSTSRSNRPRWPASARRPTSSSTCRASASRWRCTPILAADRPSIGLRLMAATGLLAAISPDLAAQRGVPQNKVQGEDLWDHRFGRSMAPPGAGRIRLAALLHDIGKPLTMADGWFLGHESVGAGLADALLERWRWPADERRRSWHWCASTCSATSRPGRTPRSAGSS